MKKILHLNVTYKTASTGKIISDIISASPNKEYEYKVLFQIGNNEDSNSFKYETKIEYFLRRVMHKFFGNISFVTFTQTKRLIKYIKRYEPDLIHIHTIHHQCINYKILFKFLSSYNKPVLFSMHDCWLFTGGCYHYTEKKCDNYLKGCLKCPKKRCDIDCFVSSTNKNILYKKNFYNNTDKLYFVTVSDWLLNQASKSILENKYIQRIHNGIDTNVFKKIFSKKINKDLFLNNRKFLVVSVASHWGKNKGIYDFFRLAKILGEDYQIVLVGEYKNVDITQSNIQLYGPTIDSSELAAIYSISNVFVNLSLEETFGLVTVEAACCGIPVVAYDSTANSEIINLVGGKLIRHPGDIEQVAYTIRDICLNKLKNEVDLQTIVQYFSKERMSAEYVSLYSRILEESGENDEYKY